MRHASSSNNGANRRMTRTRETSNSYDTNYYLDGNAVRKLLQEPDEEELKRRQIEEEQRRALAFAESVSASEKKKRHRHTKIKSAPMNKLYIGAMVIAITVLCIVSMGYVKLQSDMTNHINQISKLQNELNDLKLSNDELHTQIMSEIDLEQIRSIAINELGMKYAKEGQVVTYSSEGNDFVRQYSDIPDEIKK